MKSVIVGAGVIGRVHFNVLKDAGIPAVAVCDVNRERLERFDEVERFENYVEMLDKVKPDVVHVCTPHYLHEPMVIEALKRDINVLCEKPLCISIEGIERILAAEKASKGKLGVCHQNRYNDEIIFLKDYLKDKKIIDSYANVVWHRDAAYYLKDEWRGKWNTEGGGVLINQALHTLDLLQWITGFPEEVTASVSNLTLNNAIEVEDTATVICSGGAEFSFFATNGSSHSFPVTLTVKTEDEIIHVLPRTVVTKTGVHSFDEQRKVLGKRCYGIGHERLINDFYDAINTGRKFSIDGEEGAKVVKIILAAYRSKGKKITLN